MRRPVRSGLATTAAISSSVCRLPFISASTSPLSGELDGARRRGMAVRHVLDRDVVDLQLRLLRNGLDARARADQHRLDQAGGAGVERGRQARPRRRDERRPS